MTLNAILDAAPHPVEVIATRELGTKIFDVNTIFILGNIADINMDHLVQKKIIDIVNNHCFFKIEFDYGFIPYRGMIPYRTYTGKEYKAEEHYGTMLWQFGKLIRDKAAGIFYMSTEQLNIYDHHLGISSRKNKFHVLSSCFSEESLTLMRQIRDSDQERNDCWMTVDGQDEWQSFCKGLKEAVLFADNKKADIAVISTKTHEDMLVAMGEYDTFVLLPNIHDTCPRTAIEAKLCGAEFIGNENVQHSNEYWFKQDVESIDNYISGRPKFFWETIHNDHYLSAVS